MVSSRMSALLPMMTPPDPETAQGLHDVVVVTMTIVGPFGPVDVIDAVIIDGVDIHWPDDGDVIIEALASRHGLQTVTLPVLAGRITYQHKEQDDA